jgi:hypothetical protein
LASKEQHHGRDGPRGGGETETWMSVDHRWSLLAIVIIVIITMKKIKKKRSNGINDHSTGLFDVWRTMIQ